MYTHAHTHGTKNVPSCTCLRYTSRICAARSLTKHGAYKDTACSVYTWQIDDNVCTASPRHDGVDWYDARSRIPKEVAHSPKEISKIKNLSISKVAASVCQYIDNQ